MAAGWFFPRNLVTLACLAALVSSSCRTAEAPAERARLAAPTVSSEEASRVAHEWLVEHDGQFVDLLHRLWGLPEPAHAEFRTASLLMSTLQDAGFEIEAGVADLSTAFVASWGQGRPRIGIVTLLDALPGLAQESQVSERALHLPEDVPNPTAAGHGCGHHLISAADVAAVLAIRASMETHELAGTVRLYGAPAEEIYHGGVFMVRDGAFDDLDALLFWHPSSVTTVMGRSGLAMSSVRFDFTGLASDATDAADKGRNALSAVERLAERVRGLRSQSSWDAPTVVNHVIGNSGTIPSVVPERADIWFFVHAAEMTLVEEIVDQITVEAQGVAAAADVRVDVRRLSQTSTWLINQNLGRLIDGALTEESGETVPLSEEDQTFVRELQESFGVPATGSLYGGTLPLDFSGEPVQVSDDTADASWMVPRGGFLVACFPEGIASHTWQWTSAGKANFAVDGARRAARTLSWAAMTLLVEPERLEAIAAEFAAATDEGPYVSPLFEGQEPFDHISRPRR